MRFEREALIARRDSLRTTLQLKVDELQARDESQAKLMAATARVKQGTIAQSEAKLRLDRMTIRAPVNGRILSLVAVPGSRLSNGMGLVSGRDESTVVTMYQPESLQVRVDVRFEDLPQVTLAQPVQIRSPAVSQPLSGQVLFVSSEADIQKNTLQVKVAIENAPSVFKPDMLVDVTFLAPRIESENSPDEIMHLMVPQEAVHQGAAGSYVWLADQSEEVARKVSVQTGNPSSNGLVELTSGLNLASRVILSGADELQDGDRIRITNEEMTTSSPSAGGAKSGNLPTRYPSQGSH